MILTNGRIYTGDDALPRVAALSVTRDGRVARGVEAWEGDASQVSGERIDLDGRVVLPGFCDAHVHFRMWALEQDMVDLSMQTSVAGCAALVAEHASARQGWILGRGFHESRIEDGPPSAAALDAACPGRPVALWAHDRHTVWLSAAALDVLGAAATGDRPDGVVERLADGRPSGILRERAAFDLRLPEPTPAEALAAVARGQRVAHARGVTAIHDFEARHGFGIWQQLHGDRRQTLRVLSAQRGDRLEAVLGAELRGGFGDDMLRVGPVKTLLDGTLSSRTALMLEPFEGGGSGLSLIGADDLADLIVGASSGGLAVAIHAIGDRANREALDVLERTAAAWRPSGLRPRIEHAQLTHPVDIPRFASIGVIASMQPTHVLSDRDVADRLWGDRADYAYAWRSLADAGTALAFGSDAPIEPLDPLAAIAAAVNRTTAERPAWRPDQSLDVRRAIAAVTTGAAYAAGWEDRCGKLAPGYAADLVVLDEDPYTCPPEHIGAIGVVATMVAGRWVHGRPPW
jgi:predicted amidohydrolase YtcJ